MGLLAAGCNGGNYGVLQPSPEDLCKCIPLEPDILDFRHLAKHVPIPNVAAQEIGVDTILSWTQDAFVDPTAPRTGRELQVFHIANAFLQETSVNGADCDVHFEISQTADKNASRVIVEPPWTVNFAPPARMFSHNWRNMALNSTLSTVVNCPKDCQSRFWVWHSKTLTTTVVPRRWQPFGNYTLRP